MTGKPEERIRSPLDAVTRRLVKTVTEDSRARVSVCVRLCVCVCRTAICKV
jgi:hypothetical protein